MNDLDNRPGFGLRDDSLFSTRILSLPICPFLHTIPGQLDPDPSYRHQRAQLTGSFSNLEPDPHTRRI